MKCNLCSSTKFEELINLKCSELDTSLYKVVKLLKCENCGLIFNFLTGREEKKLKQYYTDEISMYNTMSAEKVGDLPGSNNPLTIKRYDKTFKFIKPLLKKDDKILDVGCAKGGFLNYLNVKGYKNLHGVDFVDNYLHTVDKSNIKIKNCNAEKISFKDKSFNFLIMDHLLEHTINPLKVLKEANRLLTDNGLLYIGVPNAGKYDKNFFFDYYWFLIREHIYHFDAYHLELLAKLAGFGVIKTGYSNTDMMSKGMILPNLYMILKKEKNPIELEDKEKNKLSDIIFRYIWISRGKTEKKKEVINNLYKSKEKLYIWGISKEFEYLYSNTLLKNCNIVGYIDNNEYKRKNLIINGKRIFDPFITKDSSFTVLITATAHIKSIKKKLKEYNFKGKMVIL